jgi:hypothetical protein
MATFRETLNNLFSGNVILQRDGDKKIRIIDPNQTQSAGSYYSADRYKRLIQRRGLGDYENNAYSFNQERMDLFKDYELMDRDSIISAALKVYADEATLVNEHGNMLVVETENQQIKTILENLYYDILNIEMNLWNWVRETCKYGDYPILLDIRDDLGIVDVMSLSPYIVERVEYADDSGRISTYFKIRDENSEYGGYFNKDRYEEWEIAHFRLLSDSNFLPYGRSILEGVRKHWKQISLMEDAMMIHRITRAPHKRIFKIDVAGIEPSAIDAYMERVSQELKQVPIYNQKTGEYNLRYNIQNLNEDFFIPVRGKEDGSMIDTLKGMDNNNMIDEIDYLKNRLFAGLMVPKSYLGFEDETSGRSSLAAQDVRFARSIERIQRQIESELKKIGYIHLTTQGFKLSDLTRFDVKLNNPSIIYQQEMLTLMQSKINVSKHMLDTNLFSKDYIYKFIYNLSDDEIEIEKNRLIDDKKEAFRYKQIELEGNDPVSTGKAISNGQETSNPVGRPPEGDKYNSHENNFTYDTLGTKEMMRNSNIKNTSYVKDKGQQ